MGRKEKGGMFWERSPASSNYSLDDEYYFMNLAAKKPKFCERTFNAVQNIQEKRVALEVSPSVVALVSYSGDEQFMEGSGTIIESNNDATIVLTAASFIRRCSVRNQFMENDLINDLKVTVYSQDGQSYKGEVVAVDCHYNLAAISFHSKGPLPTAKIGEVDDSLDVLLDTPSFELKHHSTSYKLSAGAEVYAVARYFYKPFDPMIASGAYWLDRCGYDCKELFKTSCRITKSGEGGPLINHLGEVIGIMYCDSTLTPCMPISIAYRWWEHFKTCGKYCRPLLGMEVGNFYTADVAMIERINQIFPSVYNGVIVEEVTEGSSASLAGLRVDDVIIECAGRRVNGFLVVYDPLSEKKTTFHRTIFIFMCPSMKCLLQDQHEQRKRPSDNPSRRSSPLWPMSSGRPSETDVPKCSYCGGPCCFELQIMPQLLHKFGMENGVNSLDWSTIVIYTCEASCDESIAYKEEFAWVQPPFQ